MRTTARQIRDNRIITVDFQHEATYFHLLGDGKAFVALVIAFVLALGFQLTHQTTCCDGGCLTRHSHSVWAGNRLAAPMHHVSRSIHRALALHLALAPDAARHGP
jgi:hypothetical protein